MSSKVFVGIGLISYSAYLWHHPLFAFRRHGDLNDTGFLVYALLMVAAFVLAGLSWRFVEQPFRKQSKINRKTVFAFAIIGSVSFIGVGTVGYLTSGFAGRLSNDQQAFIERFHNRSPEWRYLDRENMFDHLRLDCNFHNFSDMPEFRRRKESKAPDGEISADCYLRDPHHTKSVFIWGDSHAQQFHYGLKQHLPENWQILQVATFGCEAQLTATPNRNHFCDYSNWFAWKAISEARPDVVLIGQNWNHHAQTMAELSAALAQLGVPKVIFAGPTPHWRISLPVIIMHRFWENTPRRTFIGINKAVLATDLNLKHDFQTTQTARFVSVIDYFCNHDGCLTYLGDDKQNGLTTYDYGHLTLMASSFFAKDVLVPLIIN